MMRGYYRTGSLGWTLAFLLACVGTAAIADDAGGPNAAQSTYELYSVPETKWPGFSDMVTDDGGIPWIMANNRVFYWAGDGFREPVTGEMGSGQYLTGLYGGPDRGAYATQPGEEEHEGLLYRLGDGEATLVTTFYYEVSHRYPGVYVSKSGALFNWGFRFLARYNGESWDRIEADFSLRPIIFDLGDEVSFYYNNTLYCADASGELNSRPCPEWMEARPGEYSIIGTLWAGSRALLIRGGHSELFAFDLRSGEKIDLPEALTDYRHSNFQYAFSLENGDVWLLYRCLEVSGYAFLRLSADGTLSEVPETRGWCWEGTNFQYPQSALELSDGTILFGLAQDGLAIYRDGKLSQWGWEYGFPQGIRHLHEDPDGNVWFPMEGKVVRLRLGTAPPPEIAATRDWEDVVLTPRSRIWELGSGRLAMFRESTPGKLSRWDGTTWTDQDVPFDTGRIGRSAVDDRGHLLISMGSHPDGQFDIGPASVKRFDDVEPMLECAVADGAREFKSTEGFQGILVTPENHIWFGYHNYNAVYLFDGNRWDQFSFRDHVDYLFRSPKYGLLFRTQGWRFYRYDRGQMEEVYPSLKEARDLLIGEKNLQLYERSLIDEYPAEYFPVMRESGEMKLFFDPDEFEAFVEGETSDEKGGYVEVPFSSERISPIVSGGAWIWDGGAPLRLFAGRLYQLDFSGTPMSGKSVHDVKQDAEGNLWFRTSHGGSARAYCYHLSRIRLNVEQPPRRCGRELALKVSVEPERMADRLLLFTRTNGGEWCPVYADDGVLVFRFLSSGDYDCETTGMKFGGRLGNSPSFDVRAKVSLPDTILTAKEKEPILVETFEWIPPVSIHKTAENVPAVLLWRQAGGEWQRVSDDGAVSMAGLGSGTHELELCAEEEGFWRDPSPLPVTIRFEPNREAIVLSCLVDLSSADPKKQSEAKARLVELGEECVPILEEKLREAEDTARMVQPLREILLRLRGAPYRVGP
jgi:hypothetical protein